MIEVAGGCRAVDSFFCGQRGFSCGIHRLILVLISILDDSFFVETATAFFPFSREVLQVLALVFGLLFLGRFLLFQIGEAVGLAAARCLRGLGLLLGRSLSRLLCGFVLWPPPVDDRRCLRAC